MSNPASGGPESNPASSGPVPHGNQPGERPGKRAQRAPETDGGEAREPAPAAPPVTAPVPEEGDHGAAPGAEAAAPVDLPPPGPGLEVSPRTRGVLWLLAGLVLLTGVAALVAAALGRGPGWLDGVGAVAVATVLSWALAVRTGGRPWVTAALALAIGGTAVVVDTAVLRTGAAVLTTVTGGVLAVMLTVPAATYWRACREVLVATVLAAITAVAAVGFEPTVTVPRFDYASLLLGLVLVFALVYRLGAGLHGLGRRGLVAVLVGAVLLVLTLAYAELLRRYGAGSVVQSVLEFVDWTTERIGAFPRPLVVLLGIPALVWGTHMRARRRQGWWVCAFGVTATIPLAQGLLDPEGSFAEAGLQAAYSLVPGLLLGYLVVRADLALTGPRGRRGRRAEEAEAHRPEPSRLAEL